MSATAAVTLVVTVSLAFVGYVATYLYNLRLAKRASRIDLLTHQLRDFYGPLYVATQAGETAFRTLAEALGREGDLPGPGVAPTGTELRDSLDDDERRIWQTWFQHVLCPLNDIREEIILKNAYLIRESRIPACVEEFVAHASECKAIVQSWEGGDLSADVVVTGFPSGLLDYSRDSYNAVKDELMKLLGPSTGTKPSPR
jgi:hypothetical protein